MDIHAVVTDIRRDVLAGQEGTLGQHQSVGGFPRTNNSILTIHRLKPGQRYEYDDVHRLMFS